MDKALEKIKQELKERLAELNKQGKKIEAYRLEKRGGGTINDGRLVNSRRRRVKK